jgi:hypothetical protein
MAYTANKLRAQAERRLVDFDPDSADPVVATLVPGGDKGLPFSDGIAGVLAGLVRSVGTGNVDAFAIVVADDAAMTTNVTVVASHAGPTTANAVGDTIWVEATAEQLRAASATAAYVGVRVELATSTDECIVYFERKLTSARDGLTADVIQ